MTKLEKLFNQKNKSPKDFGGLINRWTLWRHLNGQRTPGIETARIYAQELDMSLEEFLKAIGK